MNEQWTLSELVKLLREFVDGGDSDLHLAEDLSPWLRNANGKLRNVEDEPSREVTGDVLFQFAFWLCRGLPAFKKLQQLFVQQSRVQAFYAVDSEPEDTDTDTSPLSLDVELDLSQLKSHPEAGATEPETFDVAVTIQSQSDPELKGRFRVHIFTVEKEDPFELGLNLAIRRILPEIPTYQELGFNTSATLVVDEILQSAAPHGIILVTGSTGSGKSTTLAAMIEAVNKKRAANIITIEDPVEFLHKNDQSYIRQICVGKSVTSYAKAVKDVLRKDPDIVLIQEIRDLETAQGAMKLAGANRLVVASIHGLTDAVSTLLNFVEMLNGNFRLVAMHLQAIITQQLLPSPDGEGRELIQEVMRPRKNILIQELLLKESKNPLEYYKAFQAEAAQKYRVTNQPGNNNKLTTPKLYETSTIQSLAEAVKEGKISEKVAYNATPYKYDLKKQLELLGVKKAVSGPLPKHLAERLKSQAGEQSNLPEEEEDFFDE